MDSYKLFDIEQYLPYLLHRAADACSGEFESLYKQKYGILQTEWRVLFHLGCFGPMTAKAICTRANIHKTKVSRAVAALENKDFLKRKTQEGDRRHETLTLTHTGRAAFEDLRGEAFRFDRDFTSKLSPQDCIVLRRCLRQIAGMT